MKVRIDALDVTVLRGGSAAVGQWATEHGFRLPPDAPEVLDFYAARSPIFLAAVFDADAAADARPGGRRRDAGPHHHPDRQPVGPAADPGPRQDRRRAGRRRRLPADRPAPGAAAGPDRHNGLILDHSAPATASLLDDLRSDRGMELGPEQGLADQGRPSTRPRRSSPSTSRSTRPGPARRRGSMAGLDLPGAPGRRRTGRSTRSGWSSGSS